jgi:hypothetical protein
LVNLTRKQWSQLYMAILVLALRMTFTKQKKLEWTARDRAQEAVQRAFERYLRLDPPEVRTLEQLQTYIAGAVRSALGHVREAEEVRKIVERAAVTEQQAIAGAAMPSPEQMNLEAGRSAGDRSRAARIVGRVRERLRRNGDSVALGTMECVTKGIQNAADQAEYLKCSLDAVYRARERRAKVLAEVTAAYVDDDEDEEKQDKQGPRDPQDKQEKK